MLVYNEFRSVMTQRVVVDQLLPIARADVEATGSAVAPIVEGADPRAQIDYLYEPSPVEIFNQLLPRYVEVQVYRALLESNAAFFAAQMTAMDTATKNSAEMIGSLTLLHEQGAAGGDHARNHRGRFGGRGALGSRP